MVATAGEIKFGDGAAPTWGGAGQGSIYFNGIDGKPYARNSQTGAITLAVTVALRLQSSNIEPASQPTGST